MINVSNEFKELMHSNTDFKEYAEITLADGTSLKLDSTQFTVSNNTITDGAGMTSIPLGVAVQKIVQLEILNDNEQYNNYDFYGAKIRLYLTFQLSNSVEKIEKGIYTVVSPETWGETVIITAYDDMYKADKNYETSLNFPTTLGNMLLDICTKCAIPIGTTTFPHSDLTVDEKPDGQYTYRQIIGFIAMLAGGNARINNSGYLEIKSYSSISQNTESEENISDSRLLKSWASLSVDKGDITVTGVAIKRTDGDTTTTILSGAEGYVITIENPLVPTDDTMQATFMDAIGSAIIGLKFRKFSGDSVANPLIEFMDLVAVRDRRGRTYKSFVTDVNFSFFGYSTIKNSAASAVLTDSVYYSAVVDTTIKARKLVEAEKTAREQAVDQLAQALATGSGLYQTQERQPDGSTIYYLHDKPTISESKTIVKLTSDAIGLSTDGGKTYQYGFTVTGDMITRILSTEGINADWINAGSLTIRDSSGVEIFSADLDKQTVTMNSAKITMDGRSLEAVFSGINSEIESNSQKTEKLETSLGVTQGQISSKIWQEDINKTLNTVTLGYTNLIRNGKTMEYMKYFLVNTTSSRRAFVGTAIVGTNTVGGTAATATISSTELPDGETGDCLKLSNCAGAAYRLYELNVADGSPYVLSFYAKSDSSTKITPIVLGVQQDPISLNSDWKRIVVKISEAKSADILFCPASNDPVYLYKGMLQRGAFDSDWSPAIEDTEGAIAGLENAYSGIQQDVNGIRTEVERFTQTADKTYATKSEMSQTASEIKSTVAESYQKKGDYATKSEVSQTASGITSIVEQNYQKKGDYATNANVSSRVEQLADSISMSVSGGAPGNTASIVLNVNGKNYTGTIDLTGLVTFNSLSTSGSTMINGDNITTGTLNSKNVTVTGALSCYNASVKFGSIGAGYGWVHDESGYYNLTDGVVVMNKDESCFLIVTSAGVRMQSGAYNIHVAKNGNAVIQSKSGEISMQGDGIYITGKIFHRNTSSDSWVQM